MRLTTDNLSAGTYRIGWHYTWRYSSTSSNFHVRIQANNNNTVHYHEQEPKDQGSDIRHSNSGFHHLTLSSGIHTIDMDYMGEGSSAQIYESRLEFWRVA